MEKDLNDRMVAWVKDQAAHERVPAMADGYRSCIPAFSSPTAALDLEQMVIDAKRQLCLVAAGKPLESTPLCYKIMALNRVLGKFREATA